MKQFVKQNYILLLVVICSLAILIGMQKCNNKKQSQQDITKAVLENRNETLEAEIKQQDAQIIGFHAVQDSLIKRIKEQSSITHAIEQKYAVIALKYATERNKVKELTGSESVRMFLDENGRKDFPVTKYSDSKDSVYLTPLSCIDSANVTKVDLKEQQAVNKNLRSEVVSLKMTNKDLTNLVSSKNNEIESLNNQIENHKQIESNKDAQLNATEKKLDAEIPKKYIVGGISVLLLTLSLVF